MHALRNNIAHLNFDIKKDGIRVKGELAEVITLIGLRRLLVVVDTTERVLSKIAEDKGFVTERK